MIDPGSLRNVERIEVIRRPITNGIHASASPAMSLLHPGAPITAGCFRPQAPQIALVASAT